jgi:hypothetical protein
MILLTAFSFQVPRVEQNVAFLSIDALSDSLSIGDSSKHREEEYHFRELHGSRKNLALTGSRGFKEDSHEIRHFKLLR